MAISLRKRNGDSEPSRSDILKLLSSAVSAFFAFANFFFGDHGNGVAFATASIILAADVFRFRYSNVLKVFFEEGSRTTRILLFVIAIGGTLLAIDEYSEISLIPPYIDTILKRLGPALVIVTIIMFITSAISDSITHTAILIKDKIVIKYAPIMYLTGFILCSEIIIIFLGYNWLDSHGSCQNLTDIRLTICLEDKEKYKIKAWNKDFIKFQLMAIAITTVWYFYSIGCIVIRIFEYYLKEKILSKK